MPSPKHMGVGVGTLLLGLTVIAAHGQNRLTLHDAIQRAENSPAARIAQSQVDAVQGQVRQAGMGPNPRLYLQSEDLRPWGNGFDFANNTEDYGYITQTFETDGKRSKRVELANANLRRTEADRNLQMQQLAGQVAASYWYAVSTARISELLQQDLAAVDEMVGYHKERVDAGAMRGVDLLRMQVERDRLLITLHAAQRDAAMARVELARQIGQPLGNDIELSDSIDALETVPQLNLSVVISQRADISAAQEAVAAAQADLKLQKALGKPDFDLSAGFKRNTGSNTIYTSMQIPIPVRNRNQGEVQRAEANVQMAQAGLDQVKQRVQADVASATEAYTREQAIVVNTLPDMRKHARENLSIMSDAYKTGGADLLRYIDAERTEIDVEVNALRTLSEFHQAAVRLQLAYGEQP